ncbi:hypothetical protein [Nocardiopsis rhodophaea]|uniref:glycine-rich domain-containing protein n=1 Tax=Nocardiopsis rhodophaea TaxID=280238 RepID=UPI0031DA5A5D
MATALAGITRGKELIALSLFDLIAGDVQRAHDHDAQTAERIVDQVLVFLLACANTPSRIGPSPMVDQGWHAFILRTSEYREFCQNVLETFVDHFPNDVMPSEKERTATAARTLDALHATGLYIDSEMWAQDVPCSSCADTQTGGDGDGCHKGCHDSQSK